MNETINCHWKPRIFDAEEARMLYERKTCEVLFRKVITPPKKEFKNEKLKPLSFMLHYIQTADGFEFLLHKELDDNEIDRVQEGIFQYGGKTYLSCLAIFPSEEQSMIVVRSNWDAAKALNRL